jgi:hypothetical protein
VTFASPQRQVQLNFYGADRDFVLPAYRSDGSLIGSQAQGGPCCGPTRDVEFTAGWVEMAYITFGWTTGVTAITELRFDN